MNFLPQLIRQWWIYIVVIVAILFFIYQIQYKDYDRGIEYFQMLNVPEPPLRKVLINIKDFQFNPDFIMVPMGTAVEWVNFDSGDTISPANRVHSIVEDRHGLFHSPDLEINDSFTFKFTRPGTYPYHSRQYPEAKGTIVVPMSDP